MGEEKKAQTRVQTDSCKPRRPEDKKPVRTQERGHNVNLCCSYPSLLTPLLCLSDLSASCLTLTRQDIIYSKMSICTHGLFVLHAYREQEKKSEDGARATHACTHAHRHTQEKEKDTWLNGGGAGERGFKKRKKKSRLSVELTQL